MEPKWIIFHFSKFPCTKRFHFCFKELNNFQSERKSGKLIIFGPENSAHVVKSCDGLIFWTFHEPLVKRLRDLPKFSHVNLARENLGWDQHGNFTFSDENYQNASRREISFQIDFGIHKMLLKNTIWVTFHQTLLECLRDLLEFHWNSGINAFWGHFCSILHETLLKSLRDWVQEFIEILG